MSGIHDVVRAEIAKLRAEAESFKAQMKDRLQKAETLEAQLAQLPTNLEAKPIPVPEPKAKAPRGTRESRIIGLLDANPTRVFSPKSMSAELGITVDPSFVSRLRTDKKIAKARIGGYCSIKAPEDIRESDDRQVDPYIATQQPELTMTQ